VSRKDATIGKLWRRLALVKASQHRTLDYIQRGFANDLGLRDVAALETIERELVSELRRHGEHMPYAGILSVHDDPWLRNRIKEIDSETKGEKGR
jgi:hypothetical protein